MISAVDESVDTTRCRGRKNCQSDDRCLTHDLWEELSRQITVFLSDISLDDLVRRRGVRQVSQRQDAIPIQLAQ